MKHLIPKTMTVGPVMALALAVGGCGSSSDDDEMMAEPTPEEMCTGAGGEWANGMCTTAEELAEARADMQRTEIGNAIMAAQTAVGAVGNDSTDAEVNEAEMKVAAARTAIANAADVPMTEKDAHTRTVGALADRLEDAKMARQMAMDDAQDAADAAMAVTAAKLYAGISMPTATDADTADTDTATGTRFAQHADATGDNAGDIEVAIGAATNVFLSEDEDTMVADNHGWKGKRYTRTKPASEGMYEAVVYSNVEEPTQGDKFGQVGVGTPATGYEYGLDAAGMFTIDASTTAAHAARVAGSMFDHTAGVKRFPLPSPNPNAETVVTFSGMFHGVSGTYSCTPDAAVCAANVVDGGFQLGTVPSATDATFSASDTVWTFKPSDPNARVMDAADTSYASYGWWIHKAANDGDFTASVFVDELGAESPAATGLDALNGTAKYTGGAAGKYALASSTGGTNDAGHFTARATLEADFTNNETATAITGTIDQFMGADGMSRPWTVKLNGSDIGDGGGIGNAGDGTDNVATEWTINGTAADDSGNWTGNLRENGTDGVPKVATGTFYSEYNTAGKMVGAFGANKE